VLDVGSAAGFILLGLMDCGWQGGGLEPNRSMVEFARSSLGVDVQCGALEGYCADETFDVVSMIQVVAHFHNVQAAFGKAAAATKPGGLWLVETWNRDSRTARFWGEKWHEFSPPSVLHWFNPAGLASLAEQFGFTEVARGRPRKRISGRHVKSLLGYLGEESKTLRAVAAISRVIPDSLEIPYPSEDLFWMVLEKER
jgi:SAM-dependent methyltransferase